MVGYTVGLFVFDDFVGLTSIQSTVQHGCRPRVRLSLWIAIPHFICLFRPFVAGISGHTEKGAYSVALSGGYDDDVDLGYAL